MDLNIDVDVLVYIVGLQVDGPFSRSAYNINTIIKKVMRRLT